MKVKFTKEEIKEVAEKLLSKIIRLDNNKAKVVALWGDLGVGKTTLTQELAKQVGIKENVISPTFIIMKIYRISPESKYHLSFKKIIHIDAYRMESPTELLNIGWEELINDSDNLILIEWPKKVVEYIPVSSLPVILSHIDNNNRTIEF